jgi:hypothetical protein
VDRDRGSGRRCAVQGKQIEAMKVSWWKNKIRITTEDKNQKVGWDVWVWKDGCGRTCAWHVQETSDKSCRPRGSVSSARLARRGYLPPLTSWNRRLVNLLYVCSISRKRLHWAPPPKPLPNDPIFIDSSWLTATLLFAGLLRWLTLAECF